MLPTILQSGAGATLPIFSLIFGQLINAVGQNLSNLPHLVTEVDKVWAPALLRFPACCSPHGAPAAGWPASPRGLCSSCCAGLPVLCVSIHCGPGGWLLRGGALDVVRCTHRPHALSGPGFCQGHSGCVLIWLLTFSGNGFCQGQSGCVQTWLLEAPSRGRYSTKLHCDEPRVPLHAKEGVRHAKCII